MSGVLHDIKSDLDGMPTDLWADLKQLAEDARPAAGTTWHDARDRGAAVGATLVGHLPERVMEKVPDVVSNRMPGTTSHGSRAKKLLLLGGLAGLVAAGIAWFRRGSAPMHPAANAYPAAPARPTTLEDEALDLPANDDLS